MSDKARAAFENALLVRVIDESHGTLSFRRLDDDRRYESLMTEAAFIGYKTGSQQAITDIGQHQAALEEVERLKAENVKLERDLKVRDLVIDRAMIIIGYADLALEGNIAPAFDNALSYLIKNKARSAR